MERKHILTYFQDNIETDQVPMEQSIPHVHIRFNIFHPPPLNFPQLKHFDQITEFEKNM